MKHRLFAAGALVLALSLLLSLRPVLAAVELVYFRAEAQADNTILVSWETATERDTTGYRLYRTESATPTDWGDPIAEYAAQGNAVTGAVYRHVDPNVASGVRYYYRLQELNSSGTSEFDPIPAGINITPEPTPTATATAPGAATATATAPGAATATRPVSGAPATLTATAPAPTATRRFTETPDVGGPTATPTQPGAATTAPLRTPTRTPLPVARVATPTGQAPRVTAPAAVPPTATPTVMSSFSTRAPSPTVERATITPSVELETPTPRPTKEVTPIIFAAETTTGGRATPEATADTAGQGSRSTSLALVIGGGAIGLAGLLAAVLLFVRSRRS